MTESELFSGSMPKREQAAQDKPATTRVQISGEWFDVALHNAVQEKFWRNIANWEPSTFSFVEAHAKPGVTFFDIGAWIGPITLLAAKRGARVIALEPDPVAFSALRDNLLLNDLAAELTCAAIHTDGGGLLLREGRNGLGDSVTSSLPLNDGQEITVPTVSVSQLLAQVSTGRKEVAFKIDIEGHEYVVGEEISEFRRDLLNSDFKVSLHLSVHSRLLNKSLRPTYFCLSRSRVRRETRRLLTAFDAESNFLCGSDLALSARDITSRFVPIWPATVRNFSVVLAK